MNTKYNQLGYQAPDLSALVPFIIIICGGVGWAVIEGGLWILSHLSITWAW